MLTRLIYASETAVALGPTGIDDLLMQARRNNRRRDITGLLVFDHRHFLQVLEGDRSTLSALCARLCADPRHRQLTLIECGAVPERRFGDWRMGFVAADARHATALLRYSGRSRFEPAGMPAAAALALLEELLRYATPEAAPA